MKQQLLLSYYQARSWAAIEFLGGASVIIAEVDLIQEDGAARQTQTTNPNGHYDEEAKQI